MSTFRRSLVAAVLLFGGAACSSETEPFGVEESNEQGVADFNYEIPAGAGEALDAGTPLEILPAELRATVGQSIEIVNVDDRGHLVGPFFVGANETLNWTFTTPGEFIGVCTVHPSGEIKVIVEEA